MELVKLLKTRTAYEKFQRNATYSYHERIIFWWNRGGKKSHEIDGVPTNIYLFKVKIETLEKGVKYFQI